MYNTANVVKEAEKLSVCTLLHLAPVYIFTLGVVISAVREYYATLSHRPASRQINLCCHAETAQKLGTFCTTVCHRGLVSECCLKLSGKTWESRGILILPLARNPVKACRLSMSSSAYHSLLLWSLLSVQFLQSCGLLIWVQSCSTIVAKMVTSGSKILWLYRDRSSNWNIVLGIKLNWFQVNWLPNQYIKQLQICCKWCPIWHPSREHIRPTSVFDLHKWLVWVRPV